VQQLVEKKEINWDLLGRIYRPDQRIPAATFRRLLRQDRIQQMVDEETSRLLASQGLSLLEIARRYRKLIDDALEKGDLKNCRLVLGDVMELYGAISANDRRPPDRRPRKQGRP
jgi:hypothetical protein